MNGRRFFILGGISALASCTQSKFRTYHGPEVTRIQLFKEARVLQLLHHNSLLAAYGFELGFQPIGHKQVEGDGRTPEGAYVIDRRNPDSRFHLSLGISYPNVNDRSVAAALGMSPGGDIFIHGTPTFYVGRRDWTWGCIAVSNDEIEEIYAMVRDGTPIFIYP